jgi:hypothetical protein
MYANILETKLADIRRFILRCQHCNAEVERFSATRKATCFKCKMDRKRFLAGGFKLMTFTCSLPNCGRETKRNIIPGRMYFCSVEHRKKGALLGLVNRKLTYAWGVVLKDSQYLRVCPNCKKQVPSVNKDYAVRASRGKTPCKKCTRNA